MPPSKYYAEVEMFTFCLGVRFFSIGTIHKPSHDTVPLFLKVVQNLWHGIDIYIYIYIIMNISFLNCNTVCESSKKTHVN